jgi:K+/H+ antiporter YhaU regulatory subunit KhtT
MVSEGLDIFEVAVPIALAGKTIAETEIRTETGCTVVALRKNGSIEIMPGPDAVLPEGGRMVLIGSAEAEKEFLERWDD